MPNYGFLCENCDKTFDCFLKIDERNDPILEECPHCKTKGKIAKDYSSLSQSLNSDSNLTPNNKTGGQWNELMSKMKHNIPKRYHGNLDSASNRSGRRWLG
jgi:putative FmdB family regulatory protein